MKLNSKLEMVMDEMEIAALLEVCEAALTGGDLSEIGVQFCGAILAHFADDEDDDVQVSLQ